MPVKRKTKVIAPEFEQEQYPQKTLNERCNNLQERLEQSLKENENLRKRITELENRPQALATFDFGELRQRITNQIEVLQNKLKAIDEFEQLIEG